MFGGMMNVSVFMMVSLLLVSAKAYAITETNVSRSFKMYSGVEGGSCNRVSPNGILMRPRILDDLNDAFEMVDIALDQIPKATLPDGENIRGLFKLFFGVSFNSDNLQPNTSDGSLVTYKLVYSNLRLVQRLNGADRRDLAVPWLRCLEDYAFFSRHVLGLDRQEDLRPGAPLAAEYYGAKMPNGRFYPGLMFVKYPAPDGSMGSYLPSSSDPWSGICDGDKSTNAFTIPANNHPLLKGITLCPHHFEASSFRRLGEPQPSSDQDVNLANLKKYSRTSGATMFHEFTHLATGNWIRDVNAVKPPDGNWKSVDFKSWVTDQESLSYGYVRTALLGLAQPWKGRTNAESYTFFALCLRFQALDCVGRYRHHIKYRAVTARTLDRVRAR